MGMPLVDNQVARDRLIGLEHNVLDFGKIVLMEVMGCDGAIIQNARTSYHADSTVRTSDDRTLLRYLMRHRHSTPFETGIVIKFFFSLPIFVERQWARHRTASWNEMSARYSVLPDKFYIPNPEDVCHQDLKNRQGRAEPLDEATANLIIEDQKRHCMEAFRIYNEHLKLNLARETARDILPFCTYTEKVWSINLHNMFHLLSLRMDKHAQYEIRVFANALGDMINELYPLSYEAFYDYRLESKTLSRLDQLVIRKIVSQHGAIDSSLFTSIANEAVPEWSAFERCRERDECLQKLIDLEIVY